ncbi:MAG: hypothetical protein KGM97_04690 [Alphaproteobacteria bacterium]|nr:hypothetical protein [Alphaproteobacteria bacterium]MDE2630270.1 hypothetical protein [Alphaproteobacteria bacterium]
MPNEKRKSPSTFRSVATLQTLARDVRPRERHQIANRFARLENERARLEREVGIWETRLQATAKKLAKVREEIEALRPLLDEAPAPKGACRSGRGQRRSPALTDTRERSPAPNRTMQLGY